MLYASRRPCFIGDATIVLAIKKKKKTALLLDDAAVNKRG